MRKHTKQLLAWAKTASEWDNENMATELENRATVYFAGRGSFDLFTMYWSPLGLYVKS